MANQLADRIKATEDEILALKTASQYSSVRSAYVNSSAVLRTGIYRITFGGQSEPILSNYYIQTSGSEFDRVFFIRVFARTPGTDEQIIEINTTVSPDGGQSSITYDANISILSNRPVISIERIS